MAPRIHLIIYYTSFHFEWLAIGLECIITTTAAAAAAGCRLSTIYETALIDCMSNMISASFQTLAPTSQ